MAQNTLVTALDQAMAALKAARKELITLQKQSKATPAKTAVKKVGAPAKAKGGMSPEGRARVAEAQRKRWAASKKAAKKAARVAAK